MQSLSSSFTDTVTCSMVQLNCPMVPGSGLKVDANPACLVVHGCITAVDSTNRLHVLVISETGNPSLGSGSAVFEAIGTVDLSNQTVSYESSKVEKKVRKKKKKKKGGVG